MENKEILTDAPVQLTSGAIKQLKLIGEKEGVSTEHGLRIGVKGGGCSGFSYILGFDTKQETDDEYYIEDIRVLVNKAHLIYLLGIEIDFVDGLENRGFTFNNPNAKDTCGCGTSFSA